VLSVVSGCLSTGGFEGSTAFACERERMVLEPSSVAIIVPVYISEGRSLEFCIKHDRDVCSLNTRDCSNHRSVRWYLVRFKESAPGH
jgi:hypothetical protein